MRPGPVTPGSAGDRARPHLTGQAGLTTRPGRGRPVAPDGPIRLGRAGLKLRLVTAPYRTRAGRRLWRRILLLVTLAVLLAALFTVGPPSPPATLAPASVLSRFQRAGHLTLARDCGHSPPPPANPP